MVSDLADEFRWIGNSERSNLPQSLNSRRKEFAESFPVLPTVNRELRIGHSKPVLKTNPATAAHFTRLVQKNQFRETRAGERGSRSRYADECGCAILAKPVSKILRTERTEGAVEHRSGSKKCLILLTSDVVSGLASPRSNEWHSGGRRFNAAPAPPITPRLTVARCGLHPRRGNARVANFTTVSIAG
jgi:hypothetical protein